jgi:hypothetical protein
MTDAAVAIAPADEQHVRRTIIREAEVTKHRLRPGFKGVELYCMLQSEPGEIGSIVQMGMDPHGLDSFPLERIVLRNPTWPL